MGDDIAQVRDDIEQMRRQMRDDDDWNGLMLDELIYRVTALEEIVAARWPRSVLVRWRLAGRFRASVAEIGGDDFTAKRLNSLGTGWSDRLQEDGRVRVWVRTTRNTGFSVGPVALAVLFPFLLVFWFGYAVVMAAYWLALLCVAGVRVIGDAMERRQHRA